MIRRRHRRAAAVDVLVVASTFPAGPDDHVPGFVRDQLIALRDLDPRLRLAVLAPRDARAPGMRPLTHHTGFDEYRFRYMIPRRMERLAGRGILPQLRANPVYWITVPPFVAAETIALLRLTLRLRPRVIYAHWFTPQALAAAVVGALTRTPFVFTSHAQDAAVLGRIPWLGPRVAGWAAGRAAAATVSSRRTRAKLDALLAPEQRARMEERCAVIPMGADPSLLNIEVREAPPGDTPTILFLGRLAEKKGVQVLLPAFAALVSTHPRARLVIAGDGPWRSRLERIGRSELGLDEESVRFAGYATGEVKRRLLASADVFVLPSITTGADAEGLPVSLLEGLASGCLCVATGSSGADEVIRDGENGFLVDEGSPEQLTAAIQRALALDDDERRRMQESARRTAEDFVWPRIARRQHAHLLEPIIGPAGAR